MMALGQVIITIVATTAPISNTLLKLIIGMTIMMTLTAIAITAAITVAVLSLVLGTSDLDFKYYYL